MAGFLIRNSLNPNKVVRLAITFRQQIFKGEDGEPMWIVEVATSEEDVNGDNILSEYIHTTSLNNIDKEIQKAASVIASKIDWEPLVDDTEAPYVYSVFPEEYLMDIDDNIKFTLKENLPSAGINDETIKMTINGIDVSDELSVAGDPYEYDVEWKPPIRIRESI